MARFSRIMWVFASVLIAHITNEGTKQPLPVRSPSEREMIGPLSWKAFVPSSENAVNLCPSPPGDDFTAVSGFDRHGEPSCCYFNPFIKAYDPQDANRKPEDTLAQLLPLGGDVWLISLGCACDQKVVRSNPRVGLVGMITPLGP